mmetsp:Transcript_30335/g.40017  ORF Transcript_30335/g.40017 Transcript_30335/m.40017 type:complete len:229 (+) Transcript_30335:199-885(+)|eukprot:CAMPEP_0117755528 /NCGR_PEP_ID=MMETSP0947-20121206/13509_1 /TAXON_ID=44440 /ORGANISM="Chattonella subsalsa, Strain CCMP2191" /LENGTH=228 /DNA_ID=CAMNT_0005574887 /DNA_START=186 /DNA_END=875 /DNA_ORIENTATION=+
MVGTDYAAPFTFEMGDLLPTKNTITKNASFEELIAKKRKVLDRLFSYRIKNENVSQVYYGSLEYDEVANKFFEKKMKGKYLIKDIQRVVNPTLWSDYVQNKCASVSEKYLWYGTMSVERAQNIVRNGFDSSILHNGLHGNGIYLEVSSKDSEKFANVTKLDTKILILCRVQIGTLLKGRYGMAKIEGHSPGSCTVDNLLDPKTYVVYETQRIFPEYTVEFAKVRKKKC